MIAVRILLKQWIFLFILTNLIHSDTLTSLIHSTYQISFNTDILILLNASISGTDLPSNSIICSDTISFNTSVSSNFTLVSANLPCPTSECIFYPSNQFTLSTQPFQILWFNSTNYYNTISSYCNPSYGGRPLCYIYYSTSASAGINPLAPYIFRSAYYKSLKRITDNAAANGSLFCTADIKFYDNGNIIHSEDLTSNPTYSFAPHTGDHLFMAHLVINNCSFLSRTYEQPQSQFYGTISPVLDVLYFNRNNPTLTYSYVIPSNNIMLKIINGPNLTLTPIQSEYTVTPGGSVTFSFKLNNTGDMNATISNVSISNGFTVTSFSPSTINAGQAVDFTVTATAPMTQPGTTVSPTISFDFNSTVPVVGTCGSASVASVNVGNVLIGDINPISVRVYTAPSGFFNEGTTFIPSKMNVTARIWREDPYNRYLENVESNISIYYYNTTIKSWKLKFNITSISGSSYSDTVNERKFALWSNSDGIFINLNETISSTSPFSYVPGVYRVEIRSYDDAATKGSKLQTNSAYFVIFNLPGCARKV